MQIDPHLKANSNKMKVQLDEDGADGILTMGRFSAYDKEFGLAWMDASGISEYFSDEGIYTFAADNDSNYVYDIIATPVEDPSLIKRFAEQFSIALDETGNPESAYLAYLYAGHDEYAMIFIRLNEIEHKGYLSNGFEQYEILPVHKAPDKDQRRSLSGYQIKVNDDYAGALQMDPGNVFWMSDEYCDATEMVLAAVASTLIKCNNL